MFQSFVRGSSLPPYNKATHNGVWRQLTVRTTTANEVMAVVIAATVDVPASIQKTHPKKKPKKKRARACASALCQQLTDARTIARPPARPPASAYVATCSPWLHRCTVPFKQAEVLAAEIASLKSWAQKCNDAGLNLASLVLSRNNSASGTMEQQESLDTIFGASHITETLNGLQFRISPEAFFQVNSRAAEKLIAVVQDKVPQLNQNTTLLDICCGTGTLGLSFARSVKRVVGMDICAASVRDANVNAELNGITNCTFTPQKAEDAIEQVLRDVAKEQSGDDTGISSVVGIVDPPRAGLHKVVIQQIRKHEGLKHLIYISCNIAGAGTNVLDLTRPTSKKCKGTPFRLVQAIPVDLFPHTDHCELVLVMERMADDQPTPNAGRGEASLADMAPGTLGNLDYSSTKQAYGFNARVKAAAAAEKKRVKDAAAAAAAAAELAVHATAVPACLEQSPLATA